MTQRPSIKGQGIGMFFGGGKLTEQLTPTTSTKPEQQNSRTTEPSRHRKMSYQEKWKREGKTQISLWLPVSLVQKLKIHAIKGNKKMSTCAEELLVNSLGSL